MFSEVSSKTMPNKAPSGTQDEEDVFSQEEISQQEVTQQNVSDAGEKPEDEEMTCT